MSAKQTKKQKPVRKKIADLNVNLFVRKGLDEDRVMVFAELIEAGQPIDPIVLSADGLTVVDGRHRIEAHHICDRTSIETTTRNDLVEEADIIAEAYRCNNTGGPLPPTREDTEHTIKLLLERKVPQTRIADMLQLAPSIARKYAQLVKSRQNRAKLVRAVSSVVEGGMTAPKAAEEHGVDLDKLREELSGKKRNKKWGVEELKRGLTARYKSLAGKNAGAMRSLLEKYEDGDVTAKQVEAIFKKFSDLQTRQARNLADWHRRFESMRDEKRHAA